MQTEDQNSNKTLGDKASHLAVSTLRGRPDHGCQLFLQRLATPTWHGLTGAHSLQCSLLLRSEHEDTMQSFSAPYPYSLEATGPRPSLWVPDNILA